MKAILIEHTGGPETMKLAEVPMPQPQHGEVRIRIAYATLNPIDVAVRSGAMKWGAPELPYVMGTEYSGVVEALGDGVDPALRGRQMVVRGQRGSLAEYAVAPVESLVAVPEGLGLALATVYRATCLTAWHALHTVGRIRAGDIVLLHSAAGPVAIMAAQVAREAGATVIGLAGGAEKCAYALPWGYDHVIDYRADAAWPETVRKLTGGRGVDLILDGVQGPDTLRNLDVLALLGQVIFLGQSAGPGPAVPIGRLIAGSAAVRGLVVHHAAQADGSDVALIDAKIITGDWRYPLNPPVPFDKVVETFTAFENRQLSGRTVFAISGDA